MNKFFKRAALVVVGGLGLSASSVAGGSITNNPDMPAVVRQVLPPAPVASADGCDAVPTTIEELRCVVHADGTFTRNTRQVTENGWYLEFRGLGNVNIDGPACVDYSPDQSRNVHDLWGDEPSVIVGGNGPSWGRRQIPDGTHTYFEVIGMTVYWFYCPEYLGAPTGDNGRPATTQVSVNINGNCNAVVVLSSQVSNVGNLCNTVNTTTTTTTTTNTSNTTGGQCGGCNTPPPQQQAAPPPPVNNPVSNNSSTGANTTCPIPLEWWAQQTGTGVNDWSRTANGQQLPPNGAFYNGRATVTVPADARFDTNAGQRSAGNQASGPFMAWHLKMCA